MPRKSNPAKKGDAVRVHKSIIDKLHCTHPKYIAKTGSVVSFTDFTDRVIEAGLKVILKPS